MAGEDFIKKIDLRRSGKCRDTVEANENAVENTVSEESLNEDINVEPCEGNVETPFEEETEIGGFVADENFIKKIGLRQSEKEHDSVEIDENIEENTINEEALNEETIVETCDETVETEIVEEETVVAEEAVAAETVVAEEAAVAETVVAEIVETEAVAAETVVAEIVETEAVAAETVVAEEAVAAEENEVIAEETPVEDIEEAIPEKDYDSGVFSTTAEASEEKDDMPTSIQFEDELIRVKYKLRYRKLLRNTLYSLLIVAAVSVLIATLFLPVLEIYGSSMNPTLANGDIVVSIKTNKLERGDICSLYYNNHLLVKRVIGLPGDYIEIDDAGNVFVNGEYLEESYVSEKVLGECDLDFPYVVPEQTVFILGDNRPVAVDSRNEQFGCISNEEIQGKIVFRVWPFKDFGVVK